MWRLTPRGRTHLAEVARSKQLFAGFAPAMIVSTPPRSGACNRARPKPPGRASRGSMILHYVGRSREALESLDRAMILNPFYPDVYLQHQAQAGIG